MAFKHVCSPQQGVVTFLPITLVMFTKPYQIAFMTPHFKTLVWCRSQYKTVHVTIQFVIIWI